MDSLDDFFDASEDVEPLDSKSEGANPEVSKVGLRAQFDFGKSLITQLDRLRERGRIPHALCFSGMDTGESVRAAFAFAQDILCEMASHSAGLTWACGTCGSCLRVAQRQSESIRFIEPEKEQIKATEIREILNYLALARDERARFIVIHQAHLMNTVAANAFLKTLEEPSDNVYFILVVYDPNSLLPTVRSRVQVIKQTASSWSQVLKLRNQKLIGDTVVGEHWLLDFWQDPDFLLRTDWKDYIKDKTKFQQLLRFWILTGVEHVSRRKGVQELETVPRVVWLFFLREILQMELSQRSNEDPVLLLESLWIRVREQLSQHGEHHDIAAGSSYGS